MKAFVRLVDPAGYVPCDWDLKLDHAARRYWISARVSGIDNFLKLGVEAAVRRGEGRAKAEGRAGECRADYVAFFEPLIDQPERLPAITMMTVAQWRERILLRHGFNDPFVDMKERENAGALPLLARVCREVDLAAGDPRGQVRVLVENLFAGNIFDMGAPATAGLFMDGGPDFFATRGKLKARPWLMDDFDALAERLIAGYRRVVFFVDNAGGDFVLGVVPLVRWLARRGTAVVIAANERASINDMTIAEVRAWWPRLVGAEGSLAGLPIEMVSTGTGDPLIDLSQVSDELNAAAAGADLVILEGMGRGVESNLEARFDCDAVNLAMIKDEMVAERHGGKIFDLVCRFRGGVVRA